MNDTHLKSFSQFIGGFSCSQRVFATLGEVRYQLLALTTLRRTYE